MSGGWSVRPAGFPLGSGPARGQCAPAGALRRRGSASPVAFIQHIHALQCRRDGLVIVRAPVGKAEWCGIRPSFTTSRTRMLASVIPCCSTNATRRASCFWRCGRCPARPASRGPHPGDAVPRGYAKRRFSAAVWAQQADGFPGRPSARRH